MLLIVPLVGGSGVMDPFRAQLPTYRMYAANSAVETVKTTLSEHGPLDGFEVTLPPSTCLVQIYAESFPQDAAQHIRVSRPSPLGPIVVAFEDDYYAIIHAHLDNMYQEYAGRFRLRD